VGAGKIVMLILGIIVILVSFAFMAAGGFLVWADVARTDGEGFTEIRSGHLERDSHAMVTEPVNIDVDEWFWDWTPIDTIKVEGSNNNPSKGIFIGLAGESDLQAYLADVEYDEIIGFSFLGSDVDYENHPGNSTPAAPVTQSFWVVAPAHGAGTQSLEWELEKGAFSLALMNDDGTASVDLDVKFMAKVNHILKIAIGSLVGGMVVLVGGVFMVYFAVRKRQA
jgi:hypothetical protein